MSDTSTSDVVDTWNSSIDSIIPEHDRVFQPHSYCPHFFLFKNENLIATVFEDMVHYLIPKEGANTDSLDFGKQDGVLSLFMLHRENGPAVEQIKMDGTERYNYYWMGEELTKTEWENKSK